MLNLLLISSRAGLVTHNAATFRSFLLIAGIHHVWAGGSHQAIEETMLHHKLESIRIVNGMIGDPVLSQSDTCISAMVGLAMVEVRPPYHQHNWTLTMYKGCVGR